MKRFCHRCERDAEFTPKPKGDKRRFASYCDTCTPEYLREYRRRRWRRVKAYDTWKGMIARCHQPGYGARYHRGVPRYAEYGGKGVSVCPQWRGPSGFERFLRDVGLPTKKTDTIDRKNPKRNYTPSNTRWVDPETQARNRRHVVMIEHQDPDTGDMLNLSIAEWARHRGLAYSTLTSRIYRGWDFDEAITAPVRRHAESPSDDAPF